MFVKLHDEGKSALPVWIGQYDMMMPRCIVMIAVWARTPAKIHQIHHSRVPQIYIPNFPMRSLVIYLKYVYHLYCNKAWAKSPNIFGEQIKKKDDKDPSNRQLLLMQARLLASPGFCEQQNVFKVATSTSWSNVGSVSLVLSWELNPGHLSENQVS